MLKSSTIFAASSVPNTRFFSLRVNVCSEIPSDFASSFCVYPAFTM
nr:MAG TPA: hypothetical protein [Caudoviricetes sp.]